MKLELEVESATVLTCLSGTDTCAIHTKNKSQYTCFPNEHLTLRFETTKGTGYKYLIDELGIDPSLIKVISNT